MCRCAGYPPSVTLPPADQVDPNASRLYELIGRIASRCGWLETILGKLICYVANTGVTQVFTTGQSASWLADHLAMAAGRVLDADEPALKEIQRIAVATKAIYARRNELTHAVWLPGPDDGMFYRAAWKRGKAEMVGGQETIASVERTLADAQRLLDRLLFDQEFANLITGAFKGQRPRWTP